MDEAVADLDDATDSLQDVMHQQRLTQTMDAPAWMTDALGGPTTAASAAAQVPEMQHAVDSATSVAPPTLEDGTTDSIDSIDTQNCTNENSVNESSAIDAPIVVETGLTIKLKYLNDVIKVTSGKPSEPIGEFTR